MDAVSVNRQWCKGCGICIAFCPRQALELREGRSAPVSGLCIACGLCERYCPDLAITVQPRKKPGKGAAATGRKKP